MGIFFFQAEDGILDLVRSRGLGDVYKRQVNRYEKPTMAFIGVLISCDILARKAVFNLSDSSAFSLAAFNSLVLSTTSTSRSS